VVASDAGGIPEVVERGVSGTLHPVGDVDAMAESAIEILSDPQLWTRYSQGGRRIAVERFSAASVVPRYEALYRRVLDGKGQPEPPR
jgi:glycosyltransferase involved in cell wall biosynthesis